MCWMWTVFALRICWFKIKSGKVFDVRECYKKSNQIVIEIIKSWWAVVKLKWMGYFPRKKTHLLSPNNRLTVTSRNYLVLTILFVNIKFIQQIMLILARITDHRASEPPTHDTIVCPICGTIFLERDVFKIHVSNCSSKKMTTGLHGDLFS